MKRPGFKVALPIVPVSETTFLQVAGGSEVRFVKDPNANVTELLFVNVEGETRALRRAK